MTLTFKARTLLGFAGLLGAVGIAVGAAGAHEGGGDLARLASIFLLIHAAVLVGLAIFADRDRGRVGIFWVAGLLLGSGSAAFGGDLAFVGFTGSHMLSGLAPVGGLLLIAGWLAISVSSFLI